MHFNRSLSAVVALFVVALFALALPTIAMDADVEPVTSREIQELLVRETSCGNQGRLRRKKFAP